VDKEGNQIAGTVNSWIKWFSFDWVVKSVLQILIIQAHNNGFLSKFNLGTIKQR
jgi:hypothetical protein